MGIRAYGALPVDVGTTEMNVFYSRPEVAAGHACPSFKVFSSNPMGALENTVDYTAFYANETNDKAQNNYSFYSKCFNGNTGNNYHFYGEGSGESYFGGLTEHAGGVKVTGGSDTSDGLPVLFYNKNRLKLSVGGKVITTWDEGGYKSLIPTVYNLEGTGNSIYGISIDTSPKGNVEDFIGYDNGKV